MLRTVLLVAAASVHLAACQSADFDAYADPPPVRRRRGPHADASLSPPTLAWDDDAELPSTISSTSHYKTGSSSMPGSFAVNRREPWLLPAVHEPRQPHPADGPITHPAADGHTSRPSSGEAWSVPAAPSSVQVTGLPPQPDWPMHEDHMPSPAAALSHDAPADAAVEVPLPGVSPLTDAAEWGTAEQQRAAEMPGAAEHERAAEMSSASEHHEGASNSTEELAVELAAPQQLATATASAAAAVALPIVAAAEASRKQSDGSPPGAGWWAGEKPVRSWRFAGLAARISRAGAAHGGAPSGRVDAAAKGVRDDEEAEWSSVRPNTDGRVGSAHVSAASNHAAAAAVASGQAPVVAVVNGSSSAGGLAEGAIGTVYEVAYS